ncbi:MAG: ATP-grasp domain-containing protein, partial [Bacillota bacterium]|nr:ATP-grasp domain-containing protein [Bacillota bacterium]
EMLLETGEKPVLFPVGAKTLLYLSGEAARERFKKVARFFIPSEVQLSLLNDKTEVARLGAHCGIPIPLEYMPPYENIVYPCVVKPAFGERFGLTAAKRYRIARNQKQLQEYIDFYKGITGETPLVQQYLDGTGAGCSVLCKDGDIHAALCHKRIREYPVSGGPSTCCRAFHSDELVDYAARLVKEVGYNGIAMIEFKYDAEGRAHLLEVNPRIWGTFPLTRVGRSSMIEHWLQLALGVSEPPIRTGEYRERKMVYAVSDLVAGIGYAKKGKLGKFFGAILDCLNPFVRDGLWEWRDIKPGIVYIKSLRNRRKK